MEKLLESFGRIAFGALILIGLSAATASAANLKLDLPVQFLEEAQVTIKKIMPGATLMKIENLISEKTESLSCSPQIWRLWYFDTHVTQATGFVQFYKVDRMDGGCLEKNDFQISSFREDQEKIMGFRELSNQSVALLLPLSKTLDQVRKLGHSDFNPNEILIYSPAQLQPPGKIYYLLTENKRTGSLKIIVDANTGAIIEILDAIPPN